MFRREAAAQEGLFDLRSNLWVRLIGKMEGHLAALHSNCHAVMCVKLSVSFVIALHFDSSVSGVLSVAERLNFEVHKKERGFST